MTAETITVTELAALCGVHPDTIYKALRRGDIPHVRVGSRYVLHRRRIRRWLTGNTTDSP